MKNLFKKLFIPSGDKSTVIAYNSWIVRWKSKSTNGYGFIPQAEIFPSEEDANKFAQQLRDAFKLIRYYDIYTTSDDRMTEVTVEANRSKLATVTE